jgi:Uroporphyrinogen decarboxylase (URO-D)
MNDRGRFVACILGEPVDRPPFWLYWGPWGTTWRRWESEEKPASIADHRMAFAPDVPPNPIPVNCGPCPKLEKTIIEETDDFVVFTDTWGILRRDYQHGESMSEFLRFPVRSQEEWLCFRDAYLNPDDPRRLDGDWREKCAAWTAQGQPIQLGYYPDVGIFGPVRWLLGDEDGLIAFVAEPELVHEIMDHMTSLYLTVFEQVVREVRVDVIHLWEDMCYRAGPLISPRKWEQFLGPCYRRIKAFADSHGIPVISVDTDGNPDLIATPMIRAGVNLLFPMEVAAGCDVNVWQTKYPTLSMMGGIDKRALAQGPAAIDRELARIAPAVEKGRYIPDLDHLIPDDVSWENYVYYAEALKRLVGK